MGLLVVIHRAAGLRVSAAGNVVIETETPTATGNHAKGIVCLMARKRLDNANARRIEIEAEIEEVAAAQEDAWHECTDPERFTPMATDPRSLCRRASGRHRLFQH